MTPASLPAQLGRYKLLRQLGQGGMGAVWLALDTRLNREVALKFPTANAEANPTAIERFQREARLAASIKHPNFCTVYDVGQDQGYHFYVMEIVPGQSLDKYLRSGVPWPLEQAASLIAALASALAELHQRGIVHRDLKPANVMVKPDGNVVLMDFGLARSFEGASDGLTVSGAIVGTASYMAPEQAAGDGSPIGPAADVWALGIMLYQMIAGRLPFTGSTREVLARILTQDPQPPSQHRADKDARLDAVCVQALHKEPEKRPATMTAFAQMLIAFQNTKRQPGDELTPTLVTQRGNRAEVQFDVPTNGPSKDRSHTEAERPPELIAEEPSPGPAHRRGLLVGGAMAGLLTVVVTAIMVCGGWRGNSTTVESKDKDNPLPKVKLVEGKSFQNSVGMDLIWIKPGRFQMGSPNSDKEAYDNEKPQHWVTITNGFWMASKEVTRGQYKQFATETGHPNQKWEKVFVGETDEHPVVNVSLDDAVKFCEWLSKKEGHTYDLPTEAKWEYCCRAGTTTRYSFGDDASQLGKYSWCRGNWGDTTHPVGKKDPNPWGLYDMHGNAWEWCKDRSRKYTSEDYTDTFSGHQGRDRVPRGGSCSNPATYCRSANRYYYSQGFHVVNYYGFRVVVHASPRTP